MIADPVDGYPVFAAYLRVKLECCTTVLIRSYVPVGNKLLSSLVALSLQLLALRFYLA